jgi:hyperosmotically inducible protein
MDTNPLMVASRVAVAAGLLTFALAGCGDDPPPPKPVAKAPAPAAPAGSATAPKSDDQAAPASKPADAGPATADRSLAARVKEALLAEKSLNAHGIEVDAKGGAVTLFGTVENKARREQAAKIAAGVDGTRSVENKLVVVAGS